MATAGRKKNPRSKSATDITSEYRGFPWCYDGVVRPRRIARSIWGLLENEVRRNVDDVGERSKALAFLDQAFEFFTAASTHRELSRPLLYYYAFLNLGKAALTLEGTEFPDVLHHGITPYYGSCSTLSGHSVKWFAGEDQAFAKFYRLFSYDRNTVLQAGSIRIAELFEEIPCVHRAYCQVARTDEIFVQAHATLLEDGARVWWRLSVDTSKISKSQKTWLCDLPSLVSREDRQEETKSSRRDYESSPRMRMGKGRSTEIACQELARQFRRDVGGHVILQSDGYRLYVGNRRTPLPQWCSSLALLFYLGSLTRYRPHQYQQATEKFSWPISELLDALPEQMLYILASWMCKTEVVRPFAVGVEARR